MLNLQSFGMPLAKYGGDGMANSFPDIIYNADHYALKASLT